MKNGRRRPVLDGNPGTDGTFSGGWGRELLRVLVHGPRGEYIIRAKYIVGSGCGTGRRVVCGYEGDDMREV